MSYLVLHMDKFKRESLRGIQSHNRRERRSRSNPDIRREKSGENYDLHQPELRDYARAVQARIDSLNLPKAVRKDAVVLCGLIVTFRPAVLRASATRGTAAILRGEPQLSHPFRGA